MVHAFNTKEIYRSLLTTYLTGKPLPETAHTSTDTEHPQLNKPLRFMIKMRNIDVDPLENTTSHLSMLESRVAVIRTFANKMTNASLKDQVLGKLQELDNLTQEMKSQSHAILNASQHLAEQNLHLAKEAAQNPSSTLNTQGFKTMETQFHQLSTRLQDLTEKMKNMPQQIELLHDKIYVAVDENTQYQMRAHPSRSERPRV